MSTYDPTDLRGQERDREEQESRERLAREIEIQDWKWLMSSKRGRRIIWRLLEFAGLFQVPPVENALKMSFFEGNRNYGVRIFGAITLHCFELYPVMVREQINGRDGDDGKSN